MRLDDVDDPRAVEEADAQVEQRVRVGVAAVEQHALVADVAQAGVQQARVLRGVDRCGHPQRGRRVRRARMPLPDLLAEVLPDAAQRKAMLTMLGIKAEE